MLNSKSITAIAGIVLGSLSMQSQAAVTFSSYSYYDIAGKSDDYGLEAFDSYGSSEYTGLNTTVSNAQVADVNGAIANSGAYVYSNVFEFEGVTSLYGSVDSEANVTVGDINNQDAWSYGDAVIDIDFSLDTTYTFSFFSEWMGASGNANVYYELSNWDSDAVVFGDYIVDNFSSAMASGTLEAGNYRLIVEAISNADVLSNNPDYSFAAADFGLELTAVPVPAAVWLFGSGLLGLAGVARRKKAA